MNATGAKTFVERRQNRIPTRRAAGARSRAAVKFDVGWFAAAVC